MPSETVRRWHEWGKSRSMIEEMREKMIEKMIKKMREKMIRTVQFL